MLTAFKLSADEGFVTNYLRKVSLQFWVVDRIYFGKVRVGGLNVVSEFAKPGDLRRFGWIFGRP